MITWDIPVEDNLLEGNAELEVDNLLEDNPELEGVDSHRVVAHRAVEADIQEREDMADQGETSAEQGALPLAVHQTHHLAYPFQSCVVSAYKRTPCSRPNQPHSSVSGRPQKVHHFQLSLQQWKICMQLVEGRT